MANTAGHWKFCAVDYHEAANEIFTALYKKIPQVGGRIWTDGVWFHITGSQTAFKAAQMVLADYGAESELKAVV